MSSKAFLPLRAQGSFAGVGRAQTILNGAPLPHPSPLRPFPSNLLGSSAVLSWPTPNVEVHIYPSALGPDA
ncbi:hypothetical protein I79_002485 [Cricetulus griseus]|uniref:Uncharacterized protein n=1 Tax=Cricetulus griseus TaxID=10029 RepID=G3GXJ3_CRIGR|nr:hypothetical protein I79_002485 [Cricetulus griseus]